MILVASSPLFKKTITWTKHSHPLIYLRGRKSVDISAIIDFIYKGEANVFQENLDSFLSIAEELQLKGLEGKGNDIESEQDYLPKERRIPIHEGKLQVQKPGPEYKTVALANHFSSDVQEVNIEQHININDDQNFKEKPMRQTII